MTNVFFMIILLLCIVFMVIFVPIHLLKDYYIFRTAKRDEPDFFIKNMDEKKIFSSFWMQFWRLMRSGEYVQFKNEDLKHKVKKSNQFCKGYFFVFIVAVISLIVIWALG